MKRRYIFIGVFALLVILSSFANFFPYSSTLQGAYRRHTGGRMGEIIFIDEHENSVIVLHWSGRFIHISHYVRRVEGDRVRFRCTGVGSGTALLNSDPESIEQFHRMLSHTWPRTDRPVFAQDGFYEIAGRRPLYNSSTDPNIFNLRINGQAPDHVIVSNVRSAIPALGEEGEETTIYFWYYADFDGSFADYEFNPEDIVITFD